MILEFLFFYSFGWFSSFQDSTKEYLLKKYSWYSDQIYQEVLKNCNVHPFVVFALIEVESNGRIFATGKPVKVYLYRNNKIVSEVHRAVGLMQVMSFHSSKQDLYDVRTNIQEGCKILNECIKIKSNFQEALSCYSMGKNSRYYNKEYVKKILSKV